MTLRVGINAMPFTPEAVTFVQEAERLGADSVWVPEFWAADAMTPRPITIPRHLLAVEALRIMETHKITSVVVVDSHGLVEGVVHLHDLWRTQMF